MVVNQKNKKRSTIGHIFQCLKFSILMSATILAQSSDRSWKSGNGKVRYSENCKFLGGVYGTTNDLFTSYKCADLCQADEPCTHFTYNWGTKKCLLQSFDKYVYPIEKKGGLFDFGLTCGYVVNRVMSVEKHEGKSIEWRLDQNESYKWGTGCVFPGNDIEAIKIAKKAECGSVCFADKRCTHFTHAWGHCYLKMIVNTNPTENLTHRPDGEEGFCGFILKRKLTKKWMKNNDDRVNWSTNCDFVGSNIEETVIRYDSKCKEKCLENKRCTHFVVSTSDSLKYCYLKEIDKNSVVEFQNYENPTCGFIVKDKTIKASKKDRVILWSDEFSAEFNSSRNWKHVIGVPQTGFQYYTNHQENSFVENGILNIKPTLVSDRFGDDFLEEGYLNLVQEGCNPKSGKQCTVSMMKSGDIINPISSAKITTQESFKFTFGTIEIRAKMPKGNWISAVISLVPENPYGEWPLSGKIELLRVNGNRNMNCSNRFYNRQVASSNLHWEHPNNEVDASSLTVSKTNQTIDFSSDFHVFRIEWSTEGFQFFVDDEFVGKLQLSESGLKKLASPYGIKKNIRISESNINQPSFFLALNVDVGGKNFPDHCTYLPGRKPWSSLNRAPMRQFWNDMEHWLPSWNAIKGENALQVDYIRVYGQKKP